MGLAGDPIDFEGKFCNLLAHALKSGARQILLKNPLQGAVDSEFGQAEEVERTLRDGPHDGEALQLDS